jgi:hypothetical protein
MAECECLKGCPFFNDKMQNKPALAQLMKKQFCLGNNENCARHMVKAVAGPASVPADLYPNQKDRVPSVLVALGKP